MLYWERIVDHTPYIPTHRLLYLERFHAQGLAFENIVLTRVLRQPYTAVLTELHI